MDGVPVRLLRNAAGRAEALLLTDDPMAAERVGGGLVESGVYEVDIPANRITSLQGVENQLAPEED